METDCCLQNQHQSRHENAKAKVNKGSAFAWTVNSDNVRDARPFCGSATFLADVSVDVQRANLREDMRSTRQSSALMDLFVPGLQDAS